MPREVPYYVRKEVPIAVPRIHDYDIPVPRKVYRPRPRVKEVRVEVPYEVEVPFKVEVPVERPVYFDVEKVVELDLGVRYRPLVEEVARENQELRWRIQELVRNVEALVEGNLMKDAEIEGLLRAKEARLLRPGAR